MLQTDWRRHFYNATAAYRRSRKTVYGLGTALSAPLILGMKLAIFTRFILDTECSSHEMTNFKFLAVILSTALISMLVLSDGLCPAVAAALAAAAGFVYASTADRLRRAA